MSGTGVGQAAYLFGGHDGRPWSVSEGNAGFVQGKEDKIKNIGRIVLRSIRTTRLDDLATSWVMVYSKEGNEKVWWAGYGTDEPAVGVGIPLLEGKVITFTSPNANHISFIAEHDGDEIYVVAGLSGEDVELEPADPDPLDRVPPTILTTFPTSGSTTAQTNVVITLTADEDLDSNTVDSTTVTLVRVSNGATVAATTSLDSSDLTKIIITPTSNLTNSVQYRVTVTTSVTDVTGNAIAAPFQFLFTTVAAPPPPDTTPPTIVSTSPATNATSVPVSISATITFSEAMLTSTINTNTIKILLASNNTEQPNLVYSMSTDNKTVTVTGGTLAYSTSYTLRIVGGSSGVKDLAGNALAATSDRAFSTAAPTLETVYSVVGNSYHNLYTGNYLETSIKLVNTSSKLRNRIGKQYSFVLRKTGAPSGSVTVVWVRGTSIIRTIKTITTSSIGTTDTTINIDDSTNTAAFASGDRIGIRYSGGSSSAYIMVKKASTNAFDANNTINARMIGSTVYDNAAEDLAGTIKCQ